MNPNVDLVREGLAAFLGGTWPGQSVEFTGGRIVRLDAYLTEDQALEAASRRL